MWKQALLGGALLLIALAGIFIGLPSSENTDLSIIGKGSNVVIQVHDPN